MLAELDSLKQSAIEEMDKGVKTLQDLEELEHRYLGKKGRLTLLLRETGKLPAAERPLAGAKANELKMQLGEIMARRRAELEKEELNRALSQERVDVTLPGGSSLGPASLHPVTRAMRDICAIFQRMGFNVESGPEIEDGFHNFDALNFPPDHPSRDSQDSFFLGDRLLRTHTSTVQVRVMQRQKPPIRMLAPGRVFRRDAFDATHAPQFHQVEGLAVDDFGKISFADLKGTLETFASHMFGPRLGVRLRPSFFPFTEPSVEMDVECFRCHGQGCPLCKHSGWIEIMGAGMVNPGVFKAVGYDPEAYSGFAFGMGVERVASLKWGIDDIRLFFENDARFLAQF